MLLAQRANAVTVSEYDISANSYGVTPESYWENNISYNIVQDSYLQANNTIPQGFKPLIDSNYNPCSCVSYAKWVTGTPQSDSWGWARYIQPLYSEPQDEGLVLTTEGGGHIAHYVRHDNLLYLDESNYVPCKKTSGRILDISSSLIRGYR